MATPVILVTGHEGTAAVTADLLGLLTDHGTATLRSVAPGSVRRADPRPRCHRREQRRRHRASMKSAIHPDHHPRRLPRCPVLRRDQVVLEMIVITMVGRPSGPGERKWDVWGSVARAVTGGHVPVKSILTGAHADPHSYQASPADAAAIVDAELVIYNGGGYDPWVDQVLAGHPGVQAVDAYSLLGAVGDDDAPNEHVFYDPNVAKAVAATIADRLADLDPSNSGNYRANAAEFSRGADAIAISEHAIATTYPDAAVIATEPVVHYLLAAAGLKNRTPATFIAANENGNDPTPADMAAVLDMIAGREVAALLVNPQTPTAATDELQVAARRAGVPITELTETLPSGTDRDQFCAADRPDRRGRSLRADHADRGLSARGHRVGDLLPTALVCHRRSGGRGRPRRASARPGNCVRRTDGRGSRPGCPDRRGTPRDVFADHPAAAAARVVVAPVAAIATSVVFAEVSAVGGILLSLAPGVPVSVFVATISFVIYLICWLLRRRR